jgi:mannose-6-phosphate isomerase-like protein (cupin superfamily)
LTDKDIVVGRRQGDAGIWVRGATLAVGEWGSTGTATEVAGLHVHQNDDEAWYVVSGALRFRLSDREVIAEAGSTVIVPAGVPHTFGNAGPEPSRFLIILPERLDRLITELHEQGVEAADHPAIYRRHDSELLE